MRLEELAARIVERKETAQKKNLAWMAQEVAEDLGEKVEAPKSRHGWDHNPDAPITYSFSRNGLHIGDHLTFYRDADSDTTTYHHVKVTYRKKVVFESNNQGVESYIPGKWEEHLKRFYEDAKAPSRKRGSEEQERQRVEAVKNEMDRITKYKAEYQAKRA